MITTKIKIEPYLAEYFIGKYNNGDTGAIKIPDDSDIYHAVWQLMMRKPKDFTPSDTNLEILLPDRRVGKNPEVYNYLSERSAKILERKIKYEFDDELHTAMRDNRESDKPFLDIERVLMFLCDYGIESITEDALLKNYQRWKNKMNMRKSRRKYEKKLNNTSKTDYKVPSSVFFRGI